MGTSLPVYLSIGTIGAAVVLTTALITSRMPMPGAMSLWGQAVLVALLATGAATAGVGAARACMLAGCSPTWVAGALLGVACGAAWAAFAIHVPMPHLLVLGDEDGVGPLAALVLTRNGAVIGAMASGIAQVFTAVWALLIR